MASIKAIEAKSVHQIQSGQVIVDLCSVVKELVENGLDAGATSIEVRFRNYGLDAIEVQDNGSGISSSDYATVALKHYTSKLSSYDDLSRVQTFGFRGEALSSLCALSKFTITTARADEAPKGTRLEFEHSGKLKGTTVVACQKGTTVVVEDLFATLPVRKKELTKNVKREYGKVIGLLHAYACISTNVKITVKNAMPKAKGLVVFATQSNATTRENIANVYGAKTLPALAPLELCFQLHSTADQRMNSDVQPSQVRVEGHISRPVFGDGRQTPDRQMFYVNGRPCGLPQIAKAINEVYRSFNVSQSPFVLANFLLDTNAYDVNVSPDKRSIMIHNAESMIESLKESLTSMFETQDQTMPLSQPQPPKLPPFRRHALSRADTVNSSLSTGSDKAEPTPNQDHTNSHVRPDPEDSDLKAKHQGRSFRDFFSNFSSTRESAEELDEEQKAKLQRYQARRAEKLAEKVKRQTSELNDSGEDDGMADDEAGITRPTVSDQEEEENIHIRDFNTRMAEQQTKKSAPSHVVGHGASPNSEAADDDALQRGDKVTTTSNVGVVPNAFSQMRPKRVSAELATVEANGKTAVITIGNKFNSQSSSKHTHTTEASHPRSRRDNPPSQFSQALRKFSAPSSTIDDDNEEDDHDSNEGKNDLTNEAEREGSIESSTGVSSRSSPAESESEDETGTCPDSSGVKTLHPAQEVEPVHSSSDRQADADYVADLIRSADETAKLSNKEVERRTALKGGQKDISTTHLTGAIACELSSIRNDTAAEVKTTKPMSLDHIPTNANDLGDENAEEQLNLTISKADFARMKVIGQFNKGFIIAVRPRHEDADSITQVQRSLCDELFMVDQHASDEKYNFERLQAETVVSSQRSVRPLVLELTAVEEEIVMENQKAIERNGFLLDIDNSGDSRVGERVALVGLPLSKEDVFDTRDLEELIHLLDETPTSGEAASIPRPSKVRKMFAMRACRSSIMIGKSLTTKQMERLLLHMGEIDKPWNCPHGRPTMRHVGTLDHFPSWEEGDGLASLNAHTPNPADAYQEYFV